MFKFSFYINLLFFIGFSSAVKKRDTTSEDNQTQQPILMKRTLHFNDNEKEINNGKERLWHNNNNNYNYNNRGQNQQLINSKINQEFRFQDLRYGNSNNNNNNHNNHNHNHNHNNNNNQPRINPRLSFENINLREQPYNYPPRELLYNYQPTNLQQNRAQPWQSWGRNQGPSSMSQLSSVDQYERESPGLNLYQTQQLNNYRPSNSINNYANDVLTDSDKKEFQELYASKQPEREQSFDFGQFKTKFTHQQQQSNQNDDDPAKFTHEVKHPNKGHHKQYFLSIHKKIESKSFEDTSTSSTNDAMFKTSNDNSIFDDDKDSLHNEPPPIPTIPQFPIISTSPQSVQSVQSYEIPTTTDSSSKSLFTQSVTHPKGYHTSYFVTSKPIMVKYPSSKEASDDYYQDKNQDNSEKEKYTEESKRNYESQGMSYRKYSPINWYSSSAQERSLNDPWLMDNKQNYYSRQSQLNPQLNPQPVSSELVNTNVRKSYRYTKPLNTHSNTQSDASELISWKAQKAFQLDHLFPNSKFFTVGTTLKF